MPDRTSTESVPSQEAPPLSPELVAVGGGLSFDDGYSPVAADADLPADQPEAADPQ